MSLQPTNRRWRKSLKGSYQPARRGSVVAASRHGSTQNVGPCVVRPVVWRDYTGAPGHLPIALRGGSSSGPCTGPTGTRSGSTGKPGLLLILKSRSGYGPHSRPCLDVDELTVRLILHLSQRKTT